MTSYEQLNPKQREQVDTFLQEGMDDDLYSIADFQVDYLREHLSDLVLSCQETALTFIERYRNLGDFDQQGKDEINQEVDAWLEKRK